MRAFVWVESWQQQCWDEFRIGSTVSWKVTRAQDGDERVIALLGPGWVPVPGSGRLRPVEVADPWEPIPAGRDLRRSFVGWIVEVDLDDRP